LTRNTGRKWPNDRRERENTPAAIKIGGGGVDAHAYIARLSLRKKKGFGLARPIKKEKGLPSEHRNLNRLSM